MVCFCKFIGQIVQHKISRNMRMTTEKVKELQNAWEAKLKKILI